jgi:2-phosphoglycerate kinase
MASKGQPPHGDARTRLAGRLWVEDSGRRRPFMRGIMIHSLMGRGVGFEDAYRTADQVRDRLRGRQAVSKQEIGKALREILGDAPFADDHALPLPPDIQVTSGGTGRPFSKGTLSQSLLAAALDPTEAFDVARQIERTLLGRGTREIERTELRHLTQETLRHQAQETLRHQAGDPAAERYMLWRRHQQSGRPLILLLGGATGVGKTSLALEVAHRLGIGRVLSTDSIRQIMRITLSKDLVPALHASSYDAWKTLPAETLGEDPVVEAFRVQASTVCVGVRASLDRAVAENASLVLDGVSIAPGLIGLEPYAEVADVIFLVVATLDEEVFGSRFSARAEGASRRPPHRYLENLDAILRIQDHFLELADRYDVPIVDNVSFDRSVLFIIRHVAEALRERGDLDVGELE